MHPFDFFAYAGQFALDFDHILRVVDKFVIELESQLHEKQVSLNVDAEARRWLAEQWDEWQPRTRNSAVEEMSRFLPLLVKPGARDVPELRTYLTTQVYGTGLGKRTLWDAIREFADVGTVGGAAFTGNAEAARRSAAKGITLMLAHGGEGEGFPVDEAVVADAFVAGSAVFSAPDPDGHYREVIARLRAGAGGA